MRFAIRSGIINTLSVLSKICDVGDMNIMLEDLTKDSIVEKSTEIFNKISNKNIAIAISGNGIEEIKRGGMKDLIGDFRIMFQLAKSKDSIAMKLHIVTGHTSFIFEEMKSELEKVDFTPLQELKSGKNNHLLLSLLNKYINLLGGRDDKTTNSDDAFEVLYNQGVLRTNEQKRDHLIYL